MASKFVIRERVHGLFYFMLLNGDGDALFVVEDLKSEQECRDQIKAIKKACTSYTKVENETDATVRTFPQKHPLQKPTVRNDDPPKAA